MAASVATGEIHAVRDFVEAAFAEVKLVLGDPSKAKEKLGREPQVTIHFSRHARRRMKLYKIPTDGVTVAIDESVTAYPLERGRTQ